MIKDNIWNMYEKILPIADYLIVKPNVPDYVYFWNKEKYCKDEYMIGSIKACLQEIV